ncbi:aspartate beta-hydroxylase domain-containing protein 2-like isoform X1 [Protopterus annectens]|uniref:aspartate beta-hydroxylase domain-containing protein 2-like isoform X1 n=1 Tax=Protopterus annectens TaxID=7888 RepID=UPI001CFAA97D|nr:aspartate beta-hydroxylase domain-containing protein 2-like isoform X1 [Protopterus annectens]
MLAVIFEMIFVIGVMTFVTFLAYTMVLILKTFYVSRHPINVLYKTLKQVLFSNKQPEQTNYFPDLNGLDKELYRRLKEYCKHYSWSGMGRIVKAIYSPDCHRCGNTANTQSPNVLHLPGVETQLYFPLDILSYDIGILEKNYLVIYREFWKAYQSPAGTVWQTHDVSKGKCFAFCLFFRGNWVKENCQHCPQTHKVVRSLRTHVQGNVFGNARFLVLLPGTFTSDRHGDSNTRLRCHLGLQVPSDCELVVAGIPQCWTPGRCLLFDDSFIRSLQIEGDESEAPLVLFEVDLWHPDITAMERQAIDYLFAPR